MKVWKTNYKGERFLVSEPEGLEIPIKTDFDWKLTESYQKALEDVKGKLKKLPNVFTVAMLIKIFPKYKRIILDIMESLRQDKVVDYVDYKPFPTKIQKV